MEKLSKTKKKASSPNSPDGLLKKSHKKGGQFKGELAKHIYLDPLPSIPGKMNSKLYPSHKMLVMEELLYQQNALIDTLRAKRAIRMELLFAHYGIDSNSPDKWMRLSFKLAIETVPGFQYQFKKNAGAKSLWNGLWLGILWHEVEKIRGKKPASWACGKLSKRRWHGKILTSGRLENLYYKAEGSAVGKARRAAMADPIMAKHLHEVWEEISQLHLGK